MLTINNDTFKKKQETFILKSDDDVFKDTEYQGLGFEITIKALTRADSINIMTNASVVDGANIKMNAGSMTRDIFVAAILGWEGIQDEDGKDIPCTSEIKAAMWDEPTLITFSDAIQLAIRNHADLAKEKKKIIKKKS